MSLQPPVLENRPLPVRQSLKADAKTISFAGSLPRFGGRDLFFGGDSLPDWTKSVADPTVTKKDAENTKVDISDLEKNKRRLASSGWQRLSKERAYRKEREKTALKYLPKEARSRLNRYLWTMYWPDRIFRPMHAKKQWIVLQGPISIKEAQMRAEKENGKIPGLKESLELVDSVKKDPKIILSDYDKFSAFEKFKLRTVLFVGGPILKFFLNLKIKEIELLKELQNNVTPLPKKHFKKQLEALEKEYNQKNPDKIKKIGDAIAAGSVGQVFEAETNSGKKLVFKVLKPEIDENYLNESRAFLYFRDLIEKGTDPQAKLKAARDAEDVIGFLREESDFRREATNTEVMKKNRDQLGITAFEIPDVLASTQQGTVLPYVGDRDFTKLTVEEQAKYKRQLMPEMARFLLLANSKPMDIHSGNVRSGNPPVLIDHGRQVNLNPAVQDQLLTLATLIYANENVEKALFDPAVRKQFKEFLNLSPTGNEEYLEHLSVLEGLTPGNSQQLNQRQELAVKALNPVTRNIFQSLLQKPNQDNKYSPNLPELEKIEWDQKISGGQEMNLSIINLWNNYLDKAPASFPKLTDKGISRADMVSYQNKLEGFAKPFFQTPDTSIKAVREKLKQIQPNEFLAAFQYPKDVKGNLREMNYKFNSSFLPGQPFSSLTGLNQPQLAESKKQSIQHHFKATMDEILQSDNPHGDRLARAYLVNTRTQQFSNTLADTLIKRLESKTGKPLQPDAAKVLKENIEVAVRNDFALTPFNMDDYSGRLNKLASLKYNDKKRQELKKPLK